MRLLYLRELFSQAIDFIVNGVFGVGHDRQGPEGREDIMDQENLGFLILLSGKIAQFVTVFSASWRLDIQQERRVRLGQRRPT